MSNAYLHGEIDVPIIIEQPTDSTGTLERPGHVCVLKSQCMARNKPERFGDHW